GSGSIPSFSSSATSLFCEGHTVSIISASENSLETLLPMFTNSIAEMTAGLWLRDLDALEAAWNECLIRHSSTDNDDDHHQQPHNNKEEPDRRKRRRNNGGGATYA
ncbi:17357_t:CDS:2, partial [Entrophospora sp. SA101]